MAQDLLENPLVLLDEVSAGLKAGTMVPYIGPGISALEPQRVPMAPGALADFFASKTTLPKRAQGNPWAAAQYIESYRFRDTVTLWMQEAFSASVPVSPFHAWLAGLPLPLIVDTWYAGEMRAALAGRDDWAEVQGITRAGIGEDRWFRFYDAAGNPVDAGEAAAARTLLYTPHGGIAPDANFLISDADYVEVLTEIDIQTPIAEEVRRRRTGMGFVFMGCHFHDQLLRTYARQIMKRSSDRHYAVVDLATLTRNERRFLDEQSIHVIDMPLGDALERLMA
ncbi:SIR2 family protein [Novosphingobium mangrovi (ex Huang et al. 2023)]|uniref:SIR2 family protein n=1 Tax=Novosphingobium mangrovi (ex Huang et al. 2023) TaxID=2976432 RepID=A0ABT2I694_9SPHN|nr:SIR2 family protein [Novosphingobium mangrovi (ex Huang et al. 2023)]MCT2400334.1 SIR2 family protein [Novosphingobium mangrovi (ex Huang et al. 2023)]